MRTDLINYGFQDANGNVWCSAWVDSYNNLNLILKETNPNNTEKLNFYLNQRHQLFVLFVELGKEKTERK